MCVSLSTIIKQKMSISSTNDFSTKNEMCFWKYIIHDQISFGCYIKQSKLIILTCITASAIVDSL